MIEFGCSCGKRFKVEDRLAGRTVQCPDCGARLRIPGTDPAATSGPAALAAAMRDAQRAAEAAPAPDEIPVAEVVSPPPDEAGAAGAAEGLEALARVVKSAPPPKPAARPAPAGVRGRKTPAGPARPAALNGRRPAPAHVGNRPVLIGVAATILVIVVLIVAAFFLGGGNPPEPPPPPPPPPVADPPQPQRYTGPQPGELWPGKRPEAEAKNP